MPNIIISSPIVGSVSEFIDWALLIVGILIIYYVFRLLMVHQKKVMESEEEWQKRGEKMREWIGNKIQKNYQKSKVKTLNQIMEEEHELKILEKLTLNVDNALDTVKNFIAHGQILKQGWSNLQNELKFFEKGLEAAKAAFREIKRRTSPQQKEVRRLMKLLEKDGKIEAADLAAMTRSEDDILVKHKNVLKFIEDIQTNLTTLLTANKEIGAKVSRTSGPLDTSTALGTTTVHIRLGTMKTNLEGFLADLEKALKEQEDAAKDLRALMVQIEKKW